jgi:ribosome-binding protein aMBF1 (putative translation factor)
MTAAFDEAPDAATVRLNGPVIRFALRCLGRSQNWLAAQVEVDPGTISRILAGQATTARVARKVRDTFPGLHTEEVVMIEGLSPAPPDGADLAAAVPVE